MKPPGRNEVKSPRRNEVAKDMMPTGRGEGKDRNYEVY